MKKFLNVMLAMVIVAVGGILLTACGSKDVVDVYLAYSHEDINLWHKSSADKTIEYDLTITYGTTINLDNFSFYCERGEKSGNWLEVDKKTDTTDGYTLEGDLGQQNAGTYTLTFSYEGWTAIVNVQINKKVVELPHLADDLKYYDGYMYTGEDYTDKIIYNHNELEMLEPNEERIEPIEAEYPDYYYNVKFSLKDSANYVWPEGVDSIIDGDGNYVFSFKIEKVWLEVDVNSDLTIDTSNSHYNTDNKIFTFSLNEISNPENPVELLNLVTINDANLAEHAQVKLFDLAGNEVSKVEITSSDMVQYNLVVVVNDSKHYQIRTNPNLNPDAYVVVATINVNKF